MNDASHHSERPVDTIPGVERRESPSTNCMRARGKLAIIDHYLQQTDAVAGQNDLFEDCLKRFYELAAPQLAEWVIDARLFTDGQETPLHSVLSAIDAELAAWQRSGIVSSQIEPLIEFSAALTELEEGILDDTDLDEGFRRRIQRDLYVSHQA